MKVIIVSDDGVIERVFSKKKFIDYVNQTIKDNDNNETFQFQEKDFDEAYDFLAEEYGYTLDLLDLED